MLLFFFTSFDLHFSLSATHTTLLLIDAFITYSGLMTLKWEWCYVPYFISMLRAYFLASFLLCVLPARFPIYQTILDLPAISILSCFVQLCHVTNTFLFHTDFLTCTFHSISLLLMTPLHCTTYASLSPASTSLILRILMCYLTVHLRVYS